MDKETALMLQNLSYSLFHLYSLWSSLFLLGCSLFMISTSIPSYGTISYLSRVLFSLNFHTLRLYPTFILLYRSVLTFVFSEPLKRLSLCIYWVLLIVVSVLRFYNISRGSKVERILLRKYYHLMAVLMFLPALVLQVTGDR